jgi:hypothetical protein
LITEILIPILTERIEIFPPNNLDYLSVLSEEIIKIISLLIPILLEIAIIIANISLFSGAIIYLLDYDEENGKKMIFRSVLIILLIVNVFNMEIQRTSEIIGLIKDYQDIASFITSYLLFIFAALSSIIFIGNLGLYIIESNSKRINGIKKSGICLACIILPLGFQFPIVPIWVM